MLLRASQGALINMCPGAHLFARGPLVGYLWTQLDVRLWDNDIRPR